MKTKKVIKPKTDIRNSLRVDLRNVKYAGILSRGIAFIVDAILLIGVRYAFTYFAVYFCIIVMSIFAFADGHLSEYERVEIYKKILEMKVFFIMLDVLVAFLYFGMFESSLKYMATPGKLLLGMMVVDLKGRPITFGASCIRLFAKPFTTPISILTIIFSLKSQGVHDSIAETLVIFKPKDFKLQ